MLFFQRVTSLVLNPLMRTVRRPEVWASAVRFVANKKRKLGRTSSHRHAMLRNMVTSLINHERIRTTMPKAKTLRPFAEKVCGVIFSF